MFLAATFPSIQPGGSQDHILVANSFFNGFYIHRPVQFKRKQYNSWLCFICFYDWLFMHVGILRENLQFSSLILAQLSATMSSFTGIIYYFASKIKILSWTCYLADH